ncbi:alpha/beta hydrolase [Spongiactinospora sp. TRM90649]|uniref:alpha/beta fold hydrolase n=1 Tax=Spongiactinospora sp. TRM90649 TaxID=3031114 RepID=UPI0023F7E3DE|nr:alpha/beta hydrolase [Spongiactinospora sp. TRM90649]MDF5757509.1 alpha/beta hydrolase [Spongiactinospora sp. TRM90649]
MVSTTRTAIAERPTTVVRLPAGPVEYRLEGDGSRTVLVFHGGHMRAGLALGEEVYADAGFTVLAPSRPGYGRTPLTTGTSATGFADVVADLCRTLGIERLAAAVGISAGGRTALTMAARHPQLVERVILQSAVGFLPWPDRMTRLGGSVLFDPRVEAGTWTAMRALLRAAPSVALRMLLRDLSVLPAGHVLTRLSAADRATLTGLFALMRSGGGFVADMLPVPDCAAQVGQPALLIATRNDRSVSFAQSESLAATMPNAELLDTQADSHMIWFDPGYPRVAAKIRDFLGKD